MQREVKENGKRLIELCKVCGSFLNERAQLWGISSKLDTVVGRLNWL